MTAKEFLKGKTLSSIDVVNNQIINLVIDETIIGLDVDTSNILFGTLLFNTNDFSYDGNILIYNGNSFDLTSITSKVNNIEVYLKALSSTYRIIDSNGQEVVFN
jgi:ubiquinone/menaquinone biosynthesis C-methylase UbiE